MIILQKLKWSNCFSYGPDNELDLSDANVTQILGSNGAGKSSIPLIIEEVLFNKNSKGIKKGDIQNRFINKGYKISLEFKKDGVDYAISVTRTGSTLKAKLTENGEDISSHTATNTYKSLQEILGLDFKTFSQVVYQSTNSSLQFLTATDTNRKKFLIDLLHLESYMQLFDFFKKESTAINLKVAGIEGEIATVENWLSSNNLSDTTIVELESEEISTEEEEKEIRSLTEEIEKISEKNKKIRKNNSNREELESIDLHKYDEYGDLQRQTYDDLSTEAGQWKTKGTSAKAVVEKVKNLKGKCPTCEQEIDPDFQAELINTHQAMVDEAREQLATIKEKVNDIKNRNQLVELKEHDQRRWEDLFRSVDTSLPVRELDQGELRTRLADLQGRVSDKQASLERVRNRNKRARDRNARISVILEQRSGMEEQLHELTNKLNELETDASNLDLLKKAFSTNGLVAYKIENLVKELEDLVNEYLAELSDGKFTLAFIISKDKLNVSLTDNGASVDISALSSGELARVNTSTLLAIRKLMSSISKSRINILFLDEVISTLDENGREKLVDVLTSEPELNTYLVSHQWSHPLLTKLYVSKYNNISKVEAV